MKKSRKYNELSNVQCNVKGCEKKIKLRLVENKHPKNAVRCWGHYKLVKNRLEADARNQEAFTAPVV